MSDRETYQIDSVEDIVIGEVRSVRVVGEDEFAVMANGKEIQIGVSLCSGCDAHVFDGMDPCDCEVYP
jgi:hypothetical protein